VNGPFNFGRDSPFTYMIHRDEAEESEVVWRADQSQHAASHNTRSEAVVSDGAAFVGVM
jgi:hypothetical protein